MKEDLSKLLVSDLRSLAKEKSVKGYYKMKKSELIKALSGLDLPFETEDSGNLKESAQEVMSAAEDLAEEVVDLAEDVAEVIEEKAEEIVEKAEEVVEDVVERAEDVIESVTEAVADIFEEEVEDPSDLPMDLYPILGDVVVYNNNSSRMVVHADYTYDESGSIVSAGIWLTDGLRRVLNKKGRQLNVLGVDGGDILFWPPENAKSVHRNGKRILPVEIQKVPPKKWWQFWKWFS